MTLHLQAYKKYKQFSVCDSARATLLTYVGAFESRDANCIASLTGDGVLVELPLIKPNRLFGKSEIERGHLATFESITDAAFSIDGEVAENHEAAICIGKIRISRMGGDIEQHDMGVVAQLTNDKLSRISLYFNSRNIRRWSDKSIL
ncbi:MAG: ketosteroid isomerase-like protein [Gammaproteobacteria bacterium]|jgi:ketosteroid isomerase-like protein